MLAFAFFRKYESWFFQKTYIGRTLQYVGRRTLDVYLLHFFFLPKNLEWVGNYVMGNANPTIELFFVAHHCHDGHRPLPAHQQYHPTESVVGTLDTWSEMINIFSIV